MKILRHAGMLAGITIVCAIAILAGGTAIAAQKIANQPTQELTNLDKAGFKVFDNPTIANNAVGGDQPKGIRTIRDMRLDRFRFSTKPEVELSDSGSCEYEISGFHDIQKAVLSYTSKGRLYAIRLISTDDHYSSVESDIRVSKLMQLIDEQFENIKWDISSDEHDGRKVAFGTKKMLRMDKTDNSEDKVFRIIPTRSKQNKVGLFVEMVDNRLRRLDDDYATTDIRVPFRVQFATAGSAASWLREQYKLNGLEEITFERKYSFEKKYDYYLRLQRLEGNMLDIVRDIHICLYDGVLMTWSNIGTAFDMGTKELKAPIEDDYAEKLIMARIRQAAYEFEGIEGRIYAIQSYVELPCPKCHGLPTRQNGRCECWSDRLGENLGRVTIKKEYFDADFADYLKKCGIVGTRQKLPGQKATAPRPVRCQACKGTGKVGGKCKKCKGSGNMSCEKCFVKTAVYKKNCPVCKGKHKVKCRYCLNGHVKSRCGKCDGTGEIGGASRTESLHDEE